MSLNDISEHPAIDWVNTYTVDVEERYKRRAMQAPRGARMTGKPALNQYTRYFDPSVRASSLATPGPGSYEWTSGVDATAFKRPTTAVLPPRQAARFSEGTHVKELNGLPGPGSYDPYRQVRSQPSVVKREEIDGWPAPGSYNPKAVGARSQETHSFSKSPRDKDADRLAGRHPQDRMAGLLARASAGARGAAMMKSAAAGAGAGVGNGTGRADGHGRGLTAAALRDEFAKPAVPGGSLRPVSPGGGGYSFSGAGRFSPATGGVRGYFASMHRRPIADRISSGALSMSLRNAAGVTSAGGSGSPQRALDSPSKAAASVLPSPRQRGASTTSAAADHPPAAAAAASSSTTAAAAAPRFAPGSIAAKFWEGVPEHLRNKGVRAVEKGARARSAQSRRMGDRQWQRLAGAKPTSPRALLMAHPEDHPESKRRDTLDRPPTAPARERERGNGRRKGAARLAARLRAQDVVRPSTATRAAADPLQDALSRAGIPSNLVEEAKESLHARGRGRMRDQEGGDRRWWTGARAEAAGRVLAWGRDEVVDTDGQEQLTAETGAVWQQHREQSEGTQGMGGMGGRGGGLSTRIVTPVPRAGVGLQGTAAPSPLQGAPRSMAGRLGGARQRPGTGTRLGGARLSAVRAGAADGTSSGSGSGDVARYPRMRPQSSRARLVSDDGPGVGPGRGAPHVSAEGQHALSDGRVVGLESTRGDGAEGGAEVDVPQLRLDRLLDGSMGGGAGIWGAAMDGRVDGHEGGSGPGIDHQGYESFVVRAPGVRVSTRSGEQSSRLGGSGALHSPLRQTGIGPQSARSTSRARPTSTLVRYNPKPPVPPVAKPLPGTTDRKIAAFRARRAVMQAVQRRQREDMRFEYERAGARKRARLWLQFACLFARVGRMHEAIRRRRSERLGASMMKALGMHKRRIFNAWRALTRRSKLIWATIVFKRVLKPAVRRFREAVLAEHVRRITAFLRYVRDMNDAIKTCRVFYGQLLKLQRFWMEVRHTTRAQLRALGRQWDRAALTIRAKGLKHRLLRERRRSQVGRTVMAIAKKQAADRPRTPTVQEALDATAEHQQQQQHRGGFRPSGHGSGSGSSSHRRRGAAGSGGTPGSSRTGTRGAGGGRSSRSGRDSRGGRASRGNSGSRDGRSSAATAPVAPESLARLGKAATSTAGGGALEDSFIRGDPDFHKPSIYIRPSGRMSPGQGGQQGTGLGVADLGSLLIRRNTATGGGGEDSDSDSGSGGGSPSGQGEGMSPRAAAQSSDVRGDIEAARERAEVALGTDEEGGQMLKATHSMASIEGGDGSGGGGDMLLAANSPLRRQQQALPRFKRPEDEEKHWESILQGLLQDADRQAGNKGAVGAAAAGAVMLSRSRTGRRASVDRAGKAEGEVARKTLHGVDLQGGPGPGSHELDVESLARGARPRGGRRLSVEMHSMQLQTIMDFPAIPLPRRTVLLRHLLHQRRTEHSRRVKDYRKRLQQWEGQLDEELGLAEARIVAIKGEVSKGERAMLRDYMLQRKPRRPVWTPLPAFRFMLDVVEHELLQERKRQAALRAAGLASEDVEDAADLLGS